MIVCDRYLLPAEFRYVIINIRYLESHVQFTDRCASWKFTFTGFRVRITLRLAVCRQSVRLGDKPLETSNFIILQSLCNILCDEKMGLSFTTAAGRRQCSHFQVRAPRTHVHNLVSQIRGSPNLEGQIPVFISPRNRVTRLYPWLQDKVKITLRLTVNQSVSLGVDSHLGLMTRCLLLFDSYGLVFLWGALSDERTGLSVVYAAGPCQRSLSQVGVPSYSRPYVIYSLRFETTLFVASYDSQSHGGGIRPRLYTGILHPWLVQLVLVI
jgi:hypothetical protein